MARNLRVVGVPGSLRDDSKTRIVVQRALRAAEDAGATTNLIDLRELEIPIYDGDAPEAGDTPELRRRIRDADAVVLGTPVYHHSYASPLKTVLDYCRFDDFEDTLVGVLAVAGGGAGGSPTEALSHLRGTVHGLRAWIYPRQVVVPNASEKVTDGEIADPDLGKRVDEFGSALIQYARDDSPATISAPI